MTATLTSRNIDSVTLIYPNMHSATVEDAYLGPEQLQALLEHFSSWLSEHMINSRRFSDWIYEKATENEIEPIMALAMLQKEQSLVQRWRVGQRPPQHVLDWACGYGAAEGLPPEARDQSKKGFSKQIKYMLGAFAGYMSHPNIQNWQSTPIKLYGPDRGRKVIAGNLETALHLRYNPRVGNGNDGISLLVRVWDRFYMEANSLGILNQTKGSPT